MTRALPRPVVLLATLAILLGSALTATSAVPAHADSGASPSPSLGSAIDLPAASALGDVYGDTVGDATMYLRQLALTHDALRGAARRKADASLSRPDLGPAQQVTCSSSVPICVHYTLVGADAAANPGWVSTVLSTLEHVYSVYQGAGYTMPEADGTIGGTQAVQTNGQPVPVNDVDIYLANIGKDGYYGYCAPERRTGSTAHHLPAFCVLDNDFSSAQFVHGTPLTNLEVTAAHEFFHAVQFAYDATEDPWFMEGTAAWVEDYVYTAINDNTQYLPYGPLGKPAQSLDKDTTFGVYGAWAFFRWVTEHRPQAQGGLPTIIRSMWQRAAATPGSADNYSLQAVKGALSAAGLPLRTAFAKFAAANRNARHTYSEGAANHYPIAKPARSFTLRSLHRVSGSARIDHLAAATERFKPSGHRLKSKHTKLHLSLDLANKSRGTDAVVTVFLRGGGTTVKPLHVSRSGKASATVPFSTKKVRRVELTMTNASTRMNCWDGGLYSCNGRPKDMRQLERFSATAKR